MDFQCFSNVTYCFFQVSQQYMKVQDVERTFPEDPFFREPSTSDVNPAQLRTERECQIMKTSAIFCARSHDEIIFMISFNVN